MPPTNVLVVRGHLATPWELRPWQALPERFDVSYLRTARNRYDLASIPLRGIDVATLSDRLPGGPGGEVMAGLLGDRYQGDAAAQAVAAADIVHAEELSFWFAADMARRRTAGGRFRLVQTVWETIPFLDAYRNRRARLSRRDVLAGTDLFLAATERARDALLLEGAAPDRIEVCPPGIDVERFRVPPPAVSPTVHTVLSPGRLVWEKGHQDVVRAVAALRRGIVALPEGVEAPRVRVVGGGREQGRLAQHAAELGVSDLLSFETVPYDEMPQVFAEASCVVLASLPMATGGYHPFDGPRIFWEEQFGLVFAEAMAAGLDIVTTTSGAIPEVVGDTATLVSSGDWMGIARALAAGPLRRPPGARVAHSQALIERYSTRAMAERLAAVYDRVLADSSS